MEVKKLDGSYMHVEEVNGMLCEVEKKELIGGVFEEGGDNVSKLLEELCENVSGVERYLVDRVLGKGDR